MLFAQPIDRHVHNDPINPSVKLRAPAKAFDRLPSFEKAVLSQVPGVLLVMHHVVNHAKYSCSVAGYQLVECFGVASLASSHQVQFRYIGVSQSRFRLHDWTEPALISFNGNNLRNRTGDATQRGIRPSG